MPGAAHALCMRGAPAPSGLPRMRAPPSSPARAPAPLQYLLLLCSAASVGASEPPVPPAGTPRYCKPLDLSKPCNVECDGPPGGDLPIYQFDLTPFQTKLQQENGYGKFVTAGEGFYTMPCMALSAVTCELKSTSAAVQYWGKPVPPGHYVDSCASLGEFNYNNCTLTQTAGKFGLLCGFVGGSPLRTGGPERRVEIIYTCAPGNPTVQGQEVPPKSGSYVITFSGAAACGVLWVKPMSIGWIILIMLPVLFLLYVVGGCIYNVKLVGKKPGLTAFPQIQYWKMLPGLVKDGCKYTYVTLRKTYYEKIRGGSVPLDGTLTARLAAPEEVQQDDRT